MSNPKTTVPEYAIECAIELYEHHSHRGVNAGNYKRLCDDSAVRIIERNAAIIASHAVKRIAELETKNIVLENANIMILADSVIADKANASLTEQLAEALRKIRKIVDSPAMIFADPDDCITTDLRRLAKIAEVE